MWNWLISSLGVGATVVLFDGNPSYPDDGAMWKLLQDEKVTIFGTSASYLNFLKSQGFNPGKDFDLSSLREISQTGSPLSAEGFEYVYQEIKQDLHFNSISGGTDINGCFAGGSPTVPVYAGELQGPALAMKVKAYDEKGRPVYDQQGELVCEAPAPSMPLYFWNDPTGKSTRAPTLTSTRGCGATATTLSCTRIRGASPSTAGRTACLEALRGAHRHGGDLQRGGPPGEVADSLVIGRIGRGTSGSSSSSSFARAYELNEELRNERSARTSGSRPLPGTSPPSSWNRAGHPLHPEHEESGERRHQHRQRPPGPEPGRAEEPRGSLDYYEKILPELRESSIRLRLPGFPGSARERVSAAAVLFSPGSRTPLRKAGSEVSLFLWTGSFGQCYEWSFFLGAEGAKRKRQERRCACSIQYKSPAESGRKTDLGHGGFEYLPNPGGSWRRPP